jgi:hypothetical protein
MKVTVVTPPGNRVSINNQQSATIKTVGVGGASGGARYLDDLIDVDASDKNGNETIVYDETTGLYVVKQLPVVDGGTF